jgi:hypothetical protein
MAATTKSADEGSVMARICAPLGMQHWSGQVAATVNPLQARLGCSSPKMSHNTFFFFAPEIA